jgi:hypothetical protein
MQVATCHSSAPVAQSVLTVLLGYSGLLCAPLRLSAPLRHVFSFLLVLIAFLVILSEAKNFNFRPDAQTEMLCALGGWSFSSDIPSSLNDELQPLRNPTLAAHP